MTTVDSTPEKVDLVMYQGDTFELYCRLKNQATGVYYDLTAWAIRSQIRATPASVTVTESFAVAIAAQAGATLGGFTLSLTAAKTAALAVGAFVWDLEATDNLGKVRTYVAGSVTVEQEITR